VQICAKWSLIGEKRWPQFWTVHNLCVGFGLIVSGSQPWRSYRIISMFSVRARENAIWCWWHIFVVHTNVTASLINLFDRTRKPATHQIFGYYRNFRKKWVSLA
jgi:hypothetical protein